MSFGIIPLCYSIAFQADRFAAGLVNLGIKRGDRIGIWMVNRLNWYIAMMGIARLGGILVSLNPAYQLPELEFSIKKVGIKVLIISELHRTQNYYKMLTKLLPDLEYGAAKVTNGNYPLERIIVDSDIQFR